MKIIKRKNTKKHLQHYFYHKTENTIHRKNKIKNERSRTLVLFLVTGTFNEDETNNDKEIQ
jgi:hypothetical protein